MADEPTVFGMLEWEEFFVWSDPEDREMLFLDVFHFVRGEQVTHRHRIRADRAKELLRQIAVHLADGDTLEIHPDGPTRPQ